MKYLPDTDGIPTTHSRKTVGIAARVVTSSDIVEGLRVGVEPRVQESEGILALSDQPVVDEGDETGEDGGGAASSGDQRELLLPDEQAAIANGRDIGEGWSVPVEQIGRAHV